MRAKFFNLIRLVCSIGKQTLSRLPFPTKLYELSAVIHKNPKPCCLVPVFKVLKGFILLRIHILSCASFNNLFFIFFRSLRNPYELEWEFSLERYFFCWVSDCFHPLKSCLFVELKRFLLLKIYSCFSQKRILKINVISFNFTLSRITHFLYKMKTTSSPHILYVQGTYQHEKMRKAMTIKMRC